MRRRKFITLLGGAASWPLTARAQQAGEHMRRVGVLMSVANGPEGQARLAAFLNGLRQAGWIEGRNVRIDQRWGAGDPERARKYAVELVALGPDVILASGDHSVASQQATRTVPIVFTVVSDPVGTGYVASLARPGGWEHGRPFSTPEGNRRHLLRWPSQRLKSRRTMPLYWLCYRHNNQISVVIEPGTSPIHARMRAALAGLDEGTFAEGHELDHKWRDGSHPHGRLRCGFS